MVYNYKMFDLYSTITSLECDGSTAECTSGCCKLATPKISKRENWQLCSISDTTNSTYSEVTEWFQN